MQIKCRNYFIYVSGIDYCSFHMAFDSGACHPQCVSTQFYLHFEENRPLSSRHEWCCRKQHQPCLCIADVTFLWGRQYTQ